jgi:hypothetical protein
MVLVCNALLYITTVDNIENCRVHIKNKPGTKYYFIHTPVKTKCIIFK